MKTRLGIVIAIIISVTGISYGSLDKPVTREEFEQKVKQQQAKIEELERVISEQKKQIIDLKWQIYHLKYGPEPNETIETKLEPLENIKLKTIIKDQKAEIARLKELCRNARIDPNSEPDRKQKKNTLKRTKPLKYTVVERQDISYLGTPRMVFRVVVETNRIPSEAELKEIAIQLWRDGNKHWKEFTVFMYLPYMDIHSIAYGIGEFRPQGLKEFEIQDFAIDIQKELTSKNTHRKNRSTAVPPVSAKSAAENRPMGISYYQVMEYLSDFFLMEKSTPVDGQDRYMGQTADNLAVLEIIGNKNNISQATLMIGIPNDAPDKLVRNTILAIRFLENTVSEWTNSNEWITANAKRVADIPGVSDVEVVKGNKLITMTFLKPFGMLTLTVKHK